MEQVKFRRKWPNVYNLLVITKLLNDVTYLSSDVKYSLYDKIKQHLLIVDNYYFGVKVG